MSARRASIGSTPTERRTLLGRTPKAVRRSGGIVIGKPNDHQKIDLAMADALAHEAACDARTAGLTKPTQPARVLVL